MAASSSTQPCWSDSETNSLIESLCKVNQYYNGKLDEELWQAIAITVNFLNRNVNAHWTHVQCRDRVNALRDTYESERAKIKAWDGLYTSPWRFYSKVEPLFGTTRNVPQTNVSEAVNTRLVLGNRRVKKRKVTGLLGCLADGIKGYAKNCERVEKKWVEEMREFETWRIALTEEMDMERRQMLADMVEKVRGKRVKKSNQVTLEESMHPEHGGSGSGKAIEQGVLASGKAHERGGSSSGKAREQG